MTPQQSKFKSAVRTCWSEMASGKRNVSPKSLGSCMKSHLKGHHAKRKHSRRRKHKR